MPASLLRLFTFALAATMSLEIVGPVVAEVPLEQLEEIRKGYLANRNGFKHGKCVFEISRWSADSEEDAVAGRTNDRLKKESLTYTLLFRDNMMIVASKYDPEETLRKALSRESFLQPSTYAKTGEYFLIQSPIINTATIYSGKSLRQATLRVHPFCLARDADINIDLALDYAERLNFAGSNYLIEEAERDGRKYLLLKSRNKYDSSDVDEYIDPERGYLSFITETYRKRSGKLSSRMFLLNVQEENGQYFPMHSVQVSPATPLDEQPFVIVREMKVLELDFNHVPADEELVVPIHRNSQFSDGVNVNTSKTPFRDSPTEFVIIPIQDIERIYLDLQILALERLKHQKQRLLESVTTRIPSGRFEADERISPHALMALTGLEIRKWWNKLSAEEREQIGSELKPFLDLVRSHSQRELDQEYVIERFDQIRDSRLKLAWAISLLQNERTPREIVDVLNEALTAEENAAFLSELLGADWPKFEAQMRRLSATERGFWIEETEDTFEIYYEQQRIATYLKRHEKLTRPALVNVCLPSGIQVTRNFPAKKPEDLDPGYSGEDGIIHPLMHPGIWISYGHLNGNDYWRLKSKVEFVDFREKDETEIDWASFSFVHHYLNDDNEIVCREGLSFQLRRVEEGLWMDIKAGYYWGKDFYFGDQEESGLGVRVASPLRVNGGNGTILNNRGEKNGAEVWGKEARWVDYFGSIDGKEVGVMIVPHKNNPRPCWMHARDYGLIVTNPFPKQPMERKEPYKKTFVAAGEEYSFGWTVLLHEMPAGESLDREQVVEELAKQATTGR